MFSNRIIQYTGFIALLNEHQIFNVSLRALDGAEIQSADLEAVGSSIAHGIVQHLAVGGRVTDNAVFAHLFAASLKLGLDQADTHSVRSGDGLRHREDMMQRDKRDIYAEKLDWLCQLVNGHVADVCALHIDHPLIGAQTPCQLTVAHIHCVDLDCTILQHTVGKAAGGCANVHADFALGGQRKTLHRLFQFQAAAADITDIMAAHLHLGILFDHLTGFVYLLFIDKDHAGHDHRLGALTALDQTMLNQILIQTNLQDSAPFHVRMACARCSASRPVLCLICGTVAWGRRTSSTPRWI